MASQFSTTASGGHHLGGGLGANGEGAGGEERREKTGRKRGTGSTGENNPAWPSRNSPVQFPAGFLTSHCVCMDVCVSCGPFLCGQRGGSWLTAGSSMRWVYIWASKPHNKGMWTHTHSQIWAYWSLTQEWGWCVYVRMCAREQGGGIL